MNPVQWYALYGEEKKGPYTYTDMIKLIQNNELAPHQYVWAPHLEEWVRAVETTEFAPETISLKYKHEDQLKVAFERRQCQRFQYNTQVLGQNGQIFFQGECLSISEGGGLFLIATPFLNLHEKVILHLRSSDDEKSVNVEGIVTYKQYTKRKIHRTTQLEYIIRFDQVGEKFENILNYLKTA